jgi:predicted RNA binding protein YcfA (HicA-like mRNA interferase family)
MKAREIVRILKEDGWYFKEQKGSHQQFIHPVKKGKVTLSYEGNDDIPPGTLGKIFKQAQIKKPKS